VSQNDLGSYAHTVICTYILVSPLLSVLNRLAVIMDQPTTIEALIEHFQNLVAFLPNLPARLPAAKDKTSDDNREAAALPPPIEPLLAHTIPPLPQASSTLISGPRDLPALLEYLSAHVLPHLNASSLSPNYYGFVTGGVTPAALLADWLVPLYDQNLQPHLPTESISTTVEVAALNQLVELFGLPARTWGLGHARGGGSAIFTTGATASNVLGLAIGREHVVRAHGRRREIHDISVAEEGLAEAMARAGIRKLRVLGMLAHSSVVKAASILGIGRANVVDVAVDGQPWRIDFAKIENAMREKDTACIFVHSAGEVNTGRFSTDGFDEMKKLRDLCDSHGMWLHVDAAFGLFARVLKEGGRDYAQLYAGVEGLELADSITGDGHKMLNVPYDCGMFFTRHKSLSEAVFANKAPYLSMASAGGPSTIQSPLNIGIENSRRFRALPVHATLIAYGKQGYFDMVKRQIDLARRIAVDLWNHPGYELLPLTADIDELLTHTFVIVLFRAKDATVNDTLLDKIKATGKMYVSGTIWDGRPAVRIAVSNWQADPVRDSDIVREVLESIAC
jgi:glutamate/tyrosine decarboxylase-like PLP-dependent enzyme